MPCFYPMPAYMTGSGSVCFAERKKYGDIRYALLLPCGQCLGCRLERSRQWAMRCMHEASCYPVNAFVTLTYDDENLPFRGQLRYAHFQKFMKRLRKWWMQEQKRQNPEIKKHEYQKIRFYMCGEYGESTERPHFHCCLFNFTFPDRKPFRVLDPNNKLYTSAVLNSLWPHGLSSIGNVTFESAAYVARYVMKKMTGPNSANHYRRFDEHGEYQLNPEFCHMSLKPGIGAPWLEKFAADVYPHDYVIVNGQKVRPPKYYDVKYAEQFPHDIEYIKFLRQVDAEKYAADQTDERLEVRATVAAAGLNQYKRDEI